VVLSPPYRNRQDLDSDLSLFPHEARSDAIGFLLNHCGYGENAVADPVPVSALAIGVERATDHRLASV